MEQTMKLWQKIFLWTLFIVMIAVSTTGIMILKNNYNTSIDRQIDNTLSEHEYLISNTKNKISAERLKGSDVLFTTDKILNIMKNIFDNNDSRDTKVALLNNEGDFFYKNNGFITDDTIITSVLKNEKTYKIILSDGRNHYLVIGSSVTLEKQQFVFLTSTNITNIYDLYKQ